MSGSDRDPLTMPAPATQTVERVTWWPLLNELPGSDIALNVATIKRLCQLPVSVVHAGRDPSFGRTRLRELCDAYLAKRA